MNKVLDCSTYQTAKESVAIIFSADEDIFSSFLEGTGDIPDSEEPCAFLLAMAHEELGVPDDEFHVTWFHGTRVADPSSFYEEGILTKSRAQVKIESILAPLAEGLERKGENPFSLSLSGKQGVMGEGPFAMLFKDVVIHAPGAHHNYVDIPEIVEDIAGCLLGKNYSSLVDRYKEITSSYVVSFLAPTRGYELERVLWYSHLMENGVEDLDSASAANTCFVGAGNSINPDSILNIEAV